MKVFYDINDVKDKWNLGPNNLFISGKFLRIFYDNHSKIKHLFFIDKNKRLYANIFKLNFVKAGNYLGANILYSFLLRFLSFNVLYLSNSFITNVFSFISDSKIDLDKLLNLIQKKYSLIVIPDFVYKKMKIKSDTFIKVEVEEEMVLSVRDNWHSMNDYIVDLKKKYRYKINKIIHNSNDVIIRRLYKDDMEDYSVNIKELFNQVIEKSRFNGPDFNTDSLHDFIDKGFVKLYGYFLHDNLVGFSSEIHDKDILYSYYVGFDRTLNKSHHLYSRMLIESISNAILSKKNKIVFGRTANEYKSNFGATPIRSYVYIKITNKFLSIILNPALQRINVSSWIQRNPFK